jgi:hypothetical protein
MRGMFCHFHLAKMCGCGHFLIKEASVRPPKLDHPPFIETLFPINNQVLEKHFFSQGTNIDYSRPHATTTP